MWLHLVLLGWLYVGLMMALAEATSAQGTIIGAVVTFVLYGLLPVGVLGYIGLAPARARRRAREAAAERASNERDAGGHAAGGPVGPIAPEREEG